MVQRSDFGIPTDERQQLEQYRGGYKAFNVMMSVAVAAWAGAMLFLHDDTITIILSIIILAGIITNGIALEKGGWEEYVKERIAADPQVRRRAVRSLMVRSLLLAIFWFLAHYIGDDQPFGRSVLYGLGYGLLMGIAYWWFGIRSALKKQRRGAAADEEGEMFDR